MAENSLVKYVARIEYELSGLLKFLNQYERRPLILIKDDGAEMDVKQEVQNIYRQLADYLDRLEEDPHIIYKNLEFVKGFRKVFHNTEKIPSILKEYLAKRIFIDDTTEEMSDFIDFMGEYSIQRSRVYGTLKTLEEVGDPHERERVSQERKFQKEQEELGLDLETRLKGHEIIKEGVEKRSKKLKEEANKLSTVALILIVMSGSFILLGNLQTGATGFSLLPAAEIAGVNFVTIYIVTSSLIVGIYLIGKFLKKW